MALELSSELRKLQPAKVRIQTPAGQEVLEPGQTRKRWATLAESIQRLEVRRIELLSQDGAILKVLDGEPEERQGDPDATLDTARMVESCLAAVTAQTKALSDALVRMSDVVAKQVETAGRRIEALEKMAHTALQTTLDLSAMIAAERAEGAEPTPAERDEDETESKLRMVERIVDLAAKTGMVGAPSATDKT